jgi:hypothetical protein
MLPEMQHQEENKVKTMNKEQVLQFAPADRGAVAPSMKIAAGVATTMSIPVPEVEVKGPPMPVWTCNGYGLETGTYASFSTPVAPLIKDEYGLRLPQTPPCPEMKEILPANLATCTLPAAVEPCRRLGPGLSGLVSSSWAVPPAPPLLLENRETQSPGLQYIFNVECFTLDAWYA